MLQIMNWLYLLHKVQTIFKAACFLRAHLLPQTYQISRSYRDTQCLCFSAQLRTLLSLLKTQASNLLAMCKTDLYQRSSFCNYNNGQRQRAYSGFAGRQKGKRFENAVISTFWTRHWITKPSKLPR